MIKANELRVNNWVNISGQTIQLEGPDLAFIFEEDGLITRCDPIPLVPEIFNKCGFKERQDGFFYYYSISYTRVAVESKIEFEYLDEQTYAWISGNTIVHISYVHQLQNLYFALTGEELTIQL